ncbi:unnamed protein product, partial [marine sediment metagenome]
MIVITQWGSPPEDVFGTVLGASSPRKRDGLENTPPYPSSYTQIIKNFFYLTTVSPLH